MDESQVRNLFVVRHGERCDNCFKKQGIKWYEKAFDKFGNYTQFDPNLPEFLPKRADVIKYYAHDSPITNRGYCSALKAGESLRVNGVNIDAVYSSPSYRCIQTADAIIKGLKNDELFIRIDPHLYQWTRWCNGVLPNFLNIKEYADVGFPVDTSYIPFSDVKTLSMKESLEEFYARSYDIIKKILQNSQGTILVVAHAGSLDTLTRELCGFQPRETDDFLKYIVKIPYLCCAHASIKSANLWRLESVSPFLQMFRGNSSILST